MYENPHMYVSNLKGRNMVASLNKKAIHSFIHSVFIFLVTHQTLGAIWCVDDTNTNTGSCLWGALTLVKGDECMTRPLLYSVICTMTEAGTGWCGAQGICFENRRIFLNKEMHFTAQWSCADINNIHIILYLLIASASSSNPSLWARSSLPWWVLKHDSNKQPHRLNQDLDLDPCSSELVRMNHSRRWQQRG